MSEMFDDEEMMGDYTPPATPDAERGVYRKYCVERLHDHEGKHRDCEYFVLDWTHDPFTLAAMRAYADACAEKYPQLAFELRRKIALYEYSGVDKP